MCGHDVFRGSCVLSVLAPGVCTWHNQSYVHVQTMEFADLGLGGFFILLLQVSVVLTLQLHLMLKVSLRAAPAFALLLGGP